MMNTRATITNVTPDTIMACHGCDLLLPKRHARTGHRIKCPRCGNMLVEPKRNSIQRSLALALSGLILFVPANVFPILTLKVLGQTQSQTLISGIIALHNEGLSLVALLVLLCSIILPLIKLLLTLFVSSCLVLRRYPLNLALAFRTYDQLDEWGMLEVYMLGILVAVVKLIDIAEVVPGLGLYCFVSLLLITVLISGCMDHELFWERIERRER